MLIFFISAETEGHQPADNFFRRDVARHEAASSSVELVQTNQQLTPALMLAVASAAQAQSSQVEAACAPA